MKGAGPLNPGNKSVLVWPEIHLRFDTTPQSLFLLMLFSDFEGIPKSSLPSRSSSSQLNYYTAVSVITVALLSSILLSHELLQVCLQLDIVACC